MPAIATGFCFWNGARLPFVDFEVLEGLTAGTPEENLDTLFGFLERCLAAACQPDALFEFLHGSLKREVTRFELLDQRLEFREGLFQIDRFLCGHGDFL